MKGFSSRWPHLGWTVFAMALVEGAGEPELDLWVAPGADCVGNNRFSDCQAAPRSSTQAVTASAPARLLGLPFYGEVTQQEITLLRGGTRLPGLLEFSPWQKGGGFLRTDVAMELAPFVSVR